MLHILTECGYAFEKKFTALALGLPLLNLQPVLLIITTHHWNLLNHGILTGYNENEISTLKYITILFQFIVSI